MNKTLNLLQKQSEELENKILSKLGKQKDNSYILLTYLLAECGEIADKVRALEGNRIKSDHITRENLAKEIVDAIYNLMLVANRYDIKLDVSWKKRLKELEEKFDN